MKRLVYLTRTGPAFEGVAAAPPATRMTFPRGAKELRGKIRRVPQKTLYPIREKQHASEEAWQKFLARANRDGVTIGQLFRALIYDYGDGKDSLKLPPTPPVKK